jgi:ATP-dependent Zn protease
VSQGWVGLIVSWLPFIVLIGFWVFFMSKRGAVGKQQAYVRRNIELLEQQQVLLERIAAALEQRNRIES